MKKLTLLLAVTLLAFALMAGTAVAASLLVNGGFESGNSGFTSQYTYTEVPWPSDQHPNMGESAVYVIGYSPFLFHALWLDYAPYEGQKQMIMNAAETPLTVWEQSVAVLPYHVYQWDAWVRACYPTNPAQLAFMVANGDDVITTSVGDTTQWSKVSGIWMEAQGATTADLKIIDNECQAGGDDWTLDGMTFTDIGSLRGKATGGAKFMVGSIEVQLDFVAMSSATGAKGIVKYTNSAGEEFMGKVTGYMQSADSITACFVGTITKSNNPNYKYFYVAVRDNGEGGAAPADQLARALAGPSPYPLDLSYALYAFTNYTGNVQVHK
jgi:hypothetical protein